MLGKNARIASELLYGRATSRLIVHIPRDKFDLIGMSFTRVSMTKSKTKYYLMENTLVIAMDQFQASAIFVTTLITKNISDYTNNKKNRRSSYIYSLLRKGKHGWRFAWLDLIK